MNSKLTSSKNWDGVRQKQKVENASWFSNGGFNIMLIKAMEHYVRAASGRIQREEIDLQTFPRMFGNMTSKKQKWMEQHQQRDRNSSIFNRIEIRKCPLKH